MTIGPSPLEPAVVGEAEEAAPTVSSVSDAPDLEVLRGFWEQSVNLFAILGPDNVLLDVNPAWTRTLGWTREELLQMGPVSLLHADDVPRTLRAVLEHATPGVALEGHENRFRTKAGAYRTLRWSGRTGPDGRAYAVACDVTELRAQRGLLQKSEERFRLAMAHAAIGMAIVGVDGRWVEVNNALCTMLGRSPEQLTTLTFQELTHPDDLDVDLEQAQALAAGEIDHYHLEKRYLRPDGSIVWGLLAGSAVRDATGVPVYYIAQIQDITPRKKAQADLRETVLALRRSNETLTEFAAVAAHELKSPVVAALSLLEILRMRINGQLSAQDRELFDLATDRLGQLAGQVDGLLRIAAVSGMPLEVADQDVCQLLRRVTEELEAVAERLTVSAQPCPVVRADPSALVLLFRNLLKNAAVHGAKHLTVHAEQVVDGMVPICFEDDGPGIPPSDRGRVLELFAGGSGRGDSHGFGVGLTICQRIVERHGGELELGEAPAGGLRVRFTLPAGSRHRPRGGEMRVPAHQGATLLASGAVQRSGALEQVVGEASRPAISWPAATSSREGETS